MCRSKPSPRRAQHEERYDTLGDPIAQLPKTERGRETWRKIVEAAAQLMHVQGVQATTVDQVLGASSTGKGQFYNFFTGKDQLVQAVLNFQAQVWLDRAEPVLRQLDSIDGFEEWFRRIQARQERLGYKGGCPVGSMAAEMADADLNLRLGLEEVFRVRRGLIYQALLGMKERGLLRPETDPEELSRFVLAAIQGGLLLASADKQGQTLEASLGSALAYLKSFVVSGIERA